MADLTSNERGLRASLNIYEDIRDFDIDKELEKIKNYYAFSDKEMILIRKFIQSLPAYGNQLEDNLYILNEKELNKNGN